jgi:hypothetical protein
VQLPYKPLTRTVLVQYSSLFRNRFLYSTVHPHPPLYVRLSQVVAGIYWQPQTYVKPQAAITVFELLMLSGVSLETF